MLKNTPPNPDDAHLLDMLIVAKLVRRYMRAVRFDEFWTNSEKRDAVALRVVVIGEAASHVSPTTQRALPSIAFKKIRGLRNRISHDYGSIDFRVVWEITQKEMGPLIAALERRLGGAG